MRGTNIEFKVGSKNERGYLAVPSAPLGGVLVLHAWWGLNEFFKAFCDRLAAEGYVAFAPDLREGKVAKTVEEAKDLLSSSNEETTFPPIVLGALDYLKSQPELKAQPVGVIGFSMGAAWALWLSTKKPSDVAAVVTFYGAWPIDFSGSKASYLGHYSPEDEWEPVDGVRALEEKIRQAHRPVTFHFYPGAKHWFIEDNQSNAFDPKAAQLAWTRTLDFLRSTLQSPRS